jgi:hypothetical protein
MILLEGDFVLLAIYTLRMLGIFFCRIHELFFKLDELQDIQTSSGSSGAAPVIKAPVNPVVKMPPQMDKRLVALEEQVTVHLSLMD